MNGPTWCWEAGPYREDGTGSSCTLPPGHDGDHRFAFNDEITVLSSFSDLSKVFDW